MKALSLTQPYATLIALGAKAVETRGWRTSYRGELAIHAAKTWPPSCEDLFWRSPFHNVLTAAKYQIPGDLRRGCIVALARLVDIVPTAKHVQVIGPQERAFGDYTAGRWAWLLEDVRPLRVPLYCRGGLSTWPVSEDLERQVRGQVAT